MKYLKYLILLALLLLSSCRKEIENPEEASSEKVTYTLRGVLSEKVKAFIADDGKFSWTENDVIDVLDSASGELCVFSCTEIDDKGNAVFTYSGEPGRNFTKAWYPASLARLDAGEVIIDLPSTWAADDIATARNFPMAATVSTDGSMPFYHLGGLLKVTLNDVPKNATALVLSSDATISGTFSISEIGLDGGAINTSGENVTVVDGEIPVKSVQEIVPGAVASSVSVALNLSSKESVTAYIPLPCGSYNYNIALMVEDETVFSKATTSAKEIGRACLVKMKAISPWPTTTLKAMYGSTSVNFVPSDLWGWFVAPGLPKDQDITIDDSGTTYGTRFPTKKHTGYLFECITGDKAVAFPLKAASDLYISTDQKMLFPLAAGASGNGIAVPSEYEVAHYGLRGNFSGGSSFDTNAGVFQKSDDVPENAGNWSWYVVRSVPCSGTPVSFKLYSTAYSAADGVLETSTSTIQNAGVSRSLAGQASSGTYSIRYDVTPGMSYDFYLREDLQKVYVCEAGAQSSSVDEDYLTTLSNYGLYNYKGSSYVCTSGIDQTWVTSSQESATFVLAKAYTFDLIQMSGLPQAPSTGVSVTVGVSVTPTIGSSKNSSVTATVKKIEGNKVWLLSEDGTGMIVNVQ